MLYGNGAYDIFQYVIYRNFTLIILHIRPPSKSRAIAEPCTSVFQIQTHINIQLSIDVTAGALLWTAFLYQMILSCEYFVKFDFRTLD